MKGSTYYGSWREILFKFASNIIAEKTWIFITTTVLLVLGLINQYVWMGVIASIYSMGKFIKAQWIKSLVN